VVTIAAAVMTIIVNIVVGALSDRTLATRGRRQVWVLGGAVVAGICLAGQGLQTTVLGMVLVWTVAQIGLSSMSAALSAAVPDEVPVTQRAFVSAFYGVGTSAGPLVGIALVSLVFTGVVSGFAAMAVLAVGLAVPFALTTRGTPLLRTERPRSRCGRSWSASSRRCGMRISRGRGAGGSSSSCPMRCNRSSSISSCAIGCTSTRTCGLSIWSRSTPWPRWRVRSRPVVTPTAQCGASGW